MPKTEEETPEAQLRPQLLRNPKGPLEEAEPWCFTNDDLVRREVHNYMFMVLSLHQPQQPPLMSPGVWVAEVHGVQHVVVRGRARNISPCYPWTLHWPLLHEEEGTPCKTPHNASWVS